MLAISRTITPDRVLKKKKKRETTGFARRREARSGSCSVASRLGRESPFLGRRREERRGGACVVASTERDPSLGGVPPAPSENRDFAIFWPKCFREAATSVNSLQQGHVVVVNVSGIPDLEDQQRAVDFIAGACYALEGQQDALAESIFIFFPRIGQEYLDSDGTVLKHSQAARDALTSLARSELKGKF
jgi:cell division inhibitor SepF